MSVSRRTRLSVIGAAASGVLVMAMTGTALAAGPEAQPDCSESVQDAQAALSTVAPAEQLQLPDLCESIPVLNTTDTEATDDGAPDTTPAAAPDEDGSDEASADDDSAADDSADEDGDGSDEDGGKKDDDKADDKADKDGGDDDKADKGDRDCADFDSQADAQAAFEESANDEERLDADDDDIACEDHFGTEDQQVAVHPRGGVATGGAGL